MDGGTRDQFCLALPGGAKRGTLAPWVSISSNASVYHTPCCLAYLRLRKLTSDEKPVTTQEPKRRLWAAESWLWCLPKEAGP